MYFNALLFVVWLVSGIATVMFILMHSGKGTGVSDLLGSSSALQGASLGIVEKNLDRVTVISLVVFTVTLVVLMFTWPTAPLATLGIS